MIQIGRRHRVHTCVYTLYIAQATLPCSRQRQRARTRARLRKMGPLSPLPLGLLDSWTLFVFVLLSWNPGLRESRHACGMRPWNLGLLLRGFLDSSCGAMAPGSTPTPRCLLQWRQGRRQRRGAYCRSLPRIPGILDSYCRGAFCVAAWLKS